MRTARLTHRWLPITTAICCLLTALALTTLAALPAHASDPMTFVGIIGLPRLTAPEGVAVNADGDVYVAEPESPSDTTGDRLVKYDADGGFLDVIAVPGTGVGQVANPSAVAVGPTGNVYVTQKLSTTVHRVSYFDALGNYVGAWGGASGSGNGQFKTPEGIAVDSLGNVYVADYGNDRIQKFTSSGGYITAWPATNPAGIALDSSDVVYVAGNGEIDRFSSTGSFLSSWSQTGASGVAIDASGNAWVTTSTAVKEYDATGSTLLGTYGSGVLFGAQGISIAPSGKVYVADAAAGHGRIQRFSSAGVAQLEWGQFPDPGVPDFPSGIAVDAADNVYITKKSSDEIQKFDADGNLLQEFGGSGNGDGELDDPAAIALGPDGSVYVADTQNQRIEKFDSSGVYVTQWGSFGSADGQVTDPAGIAVDGAGHVYVADTGNNRIQEFSTGGAFIRTWGATGTEDGNFRSPKGLAIDGSGNVWVADSTNKRIQQFTSAGGFLSKFGATGSGDGQFSAPTDLAFDAAGTLWVLDRSNHRVQRFTTGGTYLSRLGSLGLDTGQFNGPLGLAFDGTDRLLVADTANHRVQVLVDQNGPDTTVTGPASATTSTSASFTLTANDVGASFQCKLDGGSYAPCSSPMGYSGLVEGAHTFYAYATDTLGHDGNPTSYAWAIDTTAPTVNIGSMPNDPTASVSPSFTFTASENGSVFQCKLDTGAYSSCTSPKAYSNVSGGDHTFTVRATDPAGNVGQAVSYSWTIDTTPPNVSITSGPTGYVQSFNASFGFTSADGGATFDCKLDGGVPSSCSSPKGYPNLDAGQHTFSVRATDALGNVSSWASRTWTVDTETHRPDGQIATGTTYVGNNIYNTTGTNQTKTLKAPPGGSVTFKIRIQNDGSATDPFLIGGTASGKGYIIRYLYGSTDISTKVNAGTYSLPLDPGEAKIITLKVKLTTSAAVSRSILVKATSARDTTAVDAVKAIVKRV